MRSGNDGVTIGDRVGPVHVGVWVAPVTLGLDLAMLAPLALLRGTDSEALGLLFRLVYLAGVTAAVIGRVSLQVGRYYDVPRVRGAQTEWAPRRRYYMPLACMPLAGTYYVAKRRYLARQSPSDLDTTPTRRVARARDPGRRAAGGSPVGDRPRRPLDRREKSGFPGLTRRNGPGVRPRSARPVHAATRLLRSEHGGRRSPPAHSLRSFVVRREKSGFPDLNGGQADLQSAALPG